MFRDIQRERDKSFALVIQKRFLDGSFKGNVARIKEYLYAKSPIETIHRKERFEALLGAIRREDSRLIKPDPNRKAGKIAAMLT